MEVEEVRCFPDVLVLPSLMDPETEDWEYRLEYGVGATILAAR